MSLGLIAVLALITYGSRAAALVFMPYPPPRLRAVLDRIPAPLFAALAATSLVEVQAASRPETFAAAAFALAASPTRSLLWVLLAGMAGYGLGALVWS